MAELIDRKVLLKEMEKRLELKPEAIGTMYDFMRFVALDCVEEAPTIEAKPIIHAHWDKDRNCTNCGRTYMDIAIAVWEDFSESEGDIPSWCPYCGATMDGKENENEN